MQAITSTVVSSFYPIQMISTIVIQRFTSSEAKSLLENIIVYQLDNRI